MTVSCPSCLAAATSASMLPAPPVVGAVVAAGAAVAGTAVALGAAVGGAAVGTGVGAGAHAAAITTSARSKSGKTTRVTLPFILLLPSNHAKIVVCGNKMYSI